MVSDSPLPIEADTSEWDPDHCQKQGIDACCSGDWDFVENDNAAYRIARNAHQRILHPFIMVQQWFVDKMYRLAQSDMTEEQLKQFNACHQWASDWQTTIETCICEISALVVQTIPSKLTSLEEMLGVAMGAGGFCCHENIDAYLRGHYPDYRVPEMEKTVPGFKAEWLTIQGPHAPLHSD